MDTTLLTDHAPYITPDGTAGTIVRALLTITGQVPDGRPHIPMGLALVIDRSGSMGGDRIEAARAAAANAVERLHPNDIVSAIAFDDVVDVLARPARRQQQQQLVPRLLNLDARGSTNLSGGWLRGRQHMEQALALLSDAPGTSRRIVLLTDGHANVGITEPATLIELARTARMMGITTTTIGVGEGYDDALLRSMADAGGGNAWYVESPDQAQDVLAEELGNLLSVAAQSVEVTLSLSDAVEVLVVHSDWPTRQTARATWTFDLGDLYASEPKPVLLELFVPASALSALQTATMPLATLGLTADVLTAHGGVEHRTLSLPIAASLEHQAQLQPEVEHAVVLARAARAREAAARHQRANDGESAAREMRAAADAMHRSVLRQDPAFLAEIDEQVADLRALEQQYAEGMYSERDAKYQMQRSYNAKRGKRTNDGRLARGSTPDDPS